MSEPGVLTPERLDWLEKQALLGGDECLTWMYFNDDILALIAAARSRDMLDANLSRVQKHLQFVVSRRNVLDARCAAAERVVEAAEEAIVLLSQYRRALTNELKRLVPDEPLLLSDDLTLKTGAAVGRYRARLQLHRNPTAYAAAATPPVPSGASGEGE